MLEQVACGSGLERIYKFLQTDKAYNRCGVNMIDAKVPASHVVACCGLPLCPLCTANLIQPFLHAEQSMSWRSCPMPGLAHLRVTRMFVKTSCTKHISLAQHAACAWLEEKVPCYPAPCSPGIYSECSSHGCAATVQKAPDITKEALEESNPLSVEAVDLFLAIIGAEAGYMGVRALAAGGIYICGGITPRVTPVSCTLVPAHGPAVISA